MEKSLKKNAVRLCIAVSCLVLGVGLWHTGLLAFLRFDAQVTTTSVDTDSDGLTNVQEAQFATDPTRADTNGDGLKDGVSKLLGVDPNALNPASGNPKIAFEGPESYIVNDGGVTTMINKDFAVFAGKQETKVRPAAFVPNRLIIKMDDGSFNSFGGAVTMVDGRAMKLRNSLGRYGQVKDVRNAFRAANPNIGAPAARKAFEMRTAAAAKTGLNDIILVDIAPKPGEKLEDIAKEVSELPGVEYAALDYIMTASMTPNDPYFATSNSFGQGYDDLWGLKAANGINAQTAWDITQGQGIVVAVVDTGVDILHPDLAANIWVNPGEIPGNNKDDEGNGFIDDVNGWDFVKNAPITVGNDGNGHGTHVAGTIAAVGNNALGLIGVAPKAKIMPVRGLDSGGSGQMSALIAAIRYAADNGAKVINMSWGGTSPAGNLATNPTYDALTYAKNLGAVNVTAAGNDSFDAINTTPANLGASIVVGADTPGNQRASFSNYNKVDVSAPGGGAGSFVYNILSTMSDGTTLANVRPTLKVGGGVQGYWRLAGTSMATPHVAGAAALLLAGRPEYMQNPAQTQDLVKNIFRATATPLNTDQYLGAGRINILKALTMSGPTPVAQFDNLDRTIVGGSVVIKGTASASYTIQMKKDGDAIWQTIMTSPTPVTNGVLMQNWDTTDFESGAYYLKLNVTMPNGLQNSALALVTVRSFRLSRPFNNDVVRLGDTIAVAGTVQGAFTNYVIEYGKGTDPTQWSTAGVTLANGGTQPVSDGPLGTWDTSAITEGGFHAVRVTVKRAGKADVVMVSKMIYLDPNIRKGWPVKTDLGMGYQWNASVQVEDLDGDGKKEIISFGPSNPISNPSPPFVSQEPQLRVFDADGRLKWQKQVNNGGAEFFPLARMPAIADIDGDGKREIVLEEHSECPNATGKKCLIYAFRHDGSNQPGWPVQVDTNNLGMWLNKAVVDIDGDKKEEIVYLSIGPPPSSLYTRSLTVLSGNGTMRSVTGPEQCLQGHQKEPTFAVGRLDGVDWFAVVPDGKDCNGIAAINLRTGVLAWRVKLPGISNGSIVTGDLDGDGKDEVLRYSGNTLFLPPFDPPPAAQLGGWLNVLRGNGTAYPGWPKKVNTSDWIYGHQSPALGDIDGDGKLEIALPPAMQITQTDCVFNLYRHDGTMMPGWPAKASTVQPCDDLFGFFPESMSIGDVDGDGQPDLAFAAAGQNYYEVTQGKTGKSGGVWAWKANGQIIDLNGQLPGNALMTESPGASTAFVKTREPLILTDIDSDGKLNMVLMTQDDGDKLRGIKMTNTIFLWDLPAAYRADTMLWPMFQHDSGMSGRGLKSILNGAAPVCGDGKRQGSEPCDDGNKLNGDGCSSNCSLETGFTCNTTVSPNTCTKNPQLCGDGLLAAPEACDDKNIINGDGCSATCTVEYGFTCDNTMSPSICEAGKVGCFDPDGQDVMRATSVTYYGKQYPDSCPPNQDAIVSEMECQGGSYTINGRNCPIGTKCSNGACVAGGPPAGPNDSYCKETDGGANIYVAGTATAAQFNTVDRDTCVPSNGVMILQESYCGRNMPFTRILLIPCPTGTTCQVGSNGGACVGAVPASSAPAASSAPQASSIPAVSSAPAISSAPASSAPPVSSAPAIICGDGVKSGTESCDDRNLINGDGCSATCTIENGFTCNTGVSPTACTKNPVCGDGVKNTTEGCDDANTISGDGCSATCAVESGFSCNTNVSPNTCGKITVGCFDPDGQDISRATTATYYGAPWADRCEPGAQNDFRVTEMECQNGSITVNSRNCPMGTKCTDGACVAAANIPVQSNETYCKETDGGMNISIGGVTSAAVFNMTEMDTCVQTPTGMMLQEGYCARNFPFPSKVLIPCPAGTTCQGAPGSAACVGANQPPVSSAPASSAPPVSSAPAIICGDGVKSGTESCDDRNLINGDGCSATCTIENGFTCNTGVSPTACTKNPVCGDGARTGSEACDDGNTISNDGCNALCNAIDTGYKCSTGTPNICTTTCGDGLKAGAELCDDANMVNGDGCSAVCTFESGFTCNTALNPTTCTKNPVCGDGIKNGTDSCDDKNLMSGDGCSATCTIEQGYTCNISVSPNTCTKNPSTPPPAPVCFDPDGQDISRATSVVYYGNSYADYCSSLTQDHLITEMECQNGIITYAGRNCPMGTKCSNGACVAAANIPVQSNETFCKETDGGMNISVAGVTTAAAFNMTETDTCISTTVLSEGYCARAFPFTTKLLIVCPSGTACSNGACK